MNPRASMTLLTLICTTAVELSAVLPLSVATARNMNSACVSWSRGCLSVRAPVVGDSWNLFTSEREKTILE